jgi:hypothetical protein
MTFRELLLTGCVAFAAIDCGGAVTAPESNSLAPNSALSASDGSLAIAGRAGKKTRAVLNSDGKVIGIAFLEVADTRYDVTFSEGGSSYNEALASAGRKAPTLPFSRSSEAVAAVDAVRRFFNSSQPPITANDVAWDSLSDNDSRGDVVVPYSVTATDAPYAYSGWDATQQAWVFSGTFTFERDRQLGSASAWAFFTPAKGGR